MPARVWRAAAAACVAAVLGCGAPAPSGRAGYVVVDAGHTRGHPGAVSPDGHLEYDYNLQFADALAAALATGGARVARTAADGREIALADRAVGHPDADLFVAIHHDSMQQVWIDQGRQRDFRGYSIFVSEKNSRYAQSLSCARAIGAQMIAAGEAPSLYHQVSIPGEGRPLVDRPLGIHRYDDLVVLKTAPVPAVLIEVGVIANPDEQVRLRDPATVRRQADAVARGIAACLPQRPPR
jgi:N-acetylmuramoyl-L-alanine amidase